MFEARLASYLANGGRAIFVGKAVDLGEKIGALDYVQVIGEDHADNAYYNISGQRVASPSKGIYICNGKKVLIK